MISEKEFDMPDVAVLPLAVIGLVVLAGGGGFFFRTLRGRSKRGGENSGDE